MEIAGKTFLVTGTTRGIGRAIAEELADRGAQVLAGNRSGDPGSQSASENITQVRMDLGSRESIDSSCDELGERLGQIDVLVNNAGSFTAGQLETQDIAEMYDVLQVNLAGLAHLTRRVLPGMLERGSGKIVNHSSIVGYLKFPGVSTYSASKAGVTAFTECLRRELQGSGVTTLEIVTGGVDTGMLRGAADQLDGHTDPSGWQWMEPADWASKIVDAIEGDKQSLQPPGRAGIARRLAGGPSFLVDLLARGGFERR